MARSPHNAADVAASRKRGRPAARVYAPEDVAALCGVPLERVLRALETQREAFFPKAWQDGAEGAWRIPEGDFRALVGCRDTAAPPRLFPVSEFAELIGYSVPWVHRLIDLGVIECRMVFGSKRVPATAYWSLPAERPAEVPARPSSFSEDRKGAA